ncbi:MAG: hypothetical protein QG597_1696 [Actinomycetota bacterium]|nr:hypothetical protein [Actinomycetota bacterium]
MTFNNHDCPVCKGLGDKPTSGNAINRRVIRCRRCRGTGLI